jgi:SSS family solute:Na+ symporter
MVNWEMLTVFVIIFAAVAALGFWAARWRPGDLERLQEWGLAGRRFGTITSWFLLGGDVYTAYTFIAVPGLVFAAGALGFFAVPYTIIVYPIVFLVLPKFWTVARHRGYVTPADFVRERFDSSLLALLVAVTGILATMPYIALQIFGIEVVLAEIGVPLEVSLIIAFVVLAAYTYTSGLRAPALIAVVKDVCIWLVVLVAFIYIPMRLGGFGKIFEAVQHKAAHNPATFHELLPSQQYSAYATLALGSALALFLYPHTLTGILSTNSRKVVRRTAALLPAYTLLLGLMALFGYMAIAAGIKPSPIFKANSALPALFAQMFPPWFAGFSFAAIAIGALTPAAIMSIAAANLFTRNIYKEYFRPTCPERDLAPCLSRALHQLVPPSCPRHWADRRSDCWHLDGRHPEFCEFRLHHFHWGTPHPCLRGCECARRKPVLLYGLHPAFSDAGYLSRSGCHQACGL